MATINSKEIVDELIKNNGHYSDDPPVIKIVEYTSGYPGNPPCYGLIYEGDGLDRYRESQFVRNPKTIFERK